MKIVKLIYLDLEKVIHLFRIQSLCLILTSIRRKILRKMMCLLRKIFKLSRKSLAIVQKVLNQKRLSQFHKLRFKSKHQSNLKYLKINQKSVLQLRIIKVEHNHKSPLKRDMKNLTSLTFLKCVTVLRSRMILKLSYLKMSPPIHLNQYLGNHK